MHSQKPLWLFDLDNTLHNASHAIFPAIASNMNAYMEKLLGSGNPAADAALVNHLRQDYLRRYGATLMGLVKHHAVRADDFLHHAHQFDDLISMIQAPRGLPRLLNALSGSKVLLTNAPYAYSAQVVRHLGLRRHFERHISIEDMRVFSRMEPKPSVRYLRYLMAKHKVHASQCILVEDSMANLRAAKQLGMRTVLVTGYAGHRRASAAADVVVKSVLDLRLHAKRLISTAL